MQCLIEFKNNIDSVILPEHFTNPFNYTPHPLCVLAAKQIQSDLLIQDSHIKGKMYGVLIIEDNDGKIGFLAAYSGNEQNSCTSIPFVPQVFEITNPDGFFRKGEAELNKINHLIFEAENSPLLQQLICELNTAKDKADDAIKTSKIALATSKKKRQIKRIEIEKEADQEELLNQLIKESQTEKSNFNKLKKEHKKNIEEKQYKLHAYVRKISELKSLRKTKSAQLQKRLFDSYLFLNREGDVKSASTIFSQTDANVPPAGAGDCCAPKLLQYAFQHQLKPLAMAEFWWGPSPKKEIRKHAYFYPACKSKCEPILGHMLTGLNIETSKQKGKTLSIEILYEDDAIAIINKPAGLLSIPGKEEAESVFTQAKALYPKATGPLVVHRLDMATSGIMILAKTKAAHENLQKQFLDKTIQKRYVALLDGLIKENSGTIELPLRVDLNDRPRQLVCREYGKPALTKWEVIERTKTQTLVHFYPITGRTHQLRVHAAHPLGLNTPIVGDELYGLKAERLLLHAEEISFIHPETLAEMSFSCKSEF
ncbi:pseudouridine synthase [Carboxylicivirga sp. N1Y90]|uniref:RluA family pseudouridine synthase n=1 Tax=Carboxylicivirga fragile TaxID=3417571 RepID=UPI003D332D1D